MKIELTKEEAEWIKEDILDLLGSNWSEIGGFDRKNPSFNWDSYSCSGSIGEAVKDMKIKESIWNKLK